MKSFLLHSWLLSLILFSISCSGGGTSNASSSEIVLVASTPGGEPIQSLLALSPETKIDFIRWNLTLTHKEPSKNTFILNLIFGESQPNTLGFIGGGEQRTYEGQYSVSQFKDGIINREIYRLKSSQLPKEISIVKLNENLFHLLTPENQLMIGNGGWSFSLNRKNPVKNAGVLPLLTDLSNLPKDTSRQIIFEGRTPCQDFAKDHHWKVSPDCFKKKWRILLNKDPQTLLPATYSLRRVIDNEPKDTEGKWTYVKGTSSNPNVLIYQLDPDKPEESVSLLAGDENVLFFMNKSNELYVGNGDFIYTLNKRK